MCNICYWRPISILLNGLLNVCLRIRSILNADWELKLINSQFLCIAIKIDLILKGVQRAYKSISLWILME